MEKDGSGRRLIVAYGRLSDHQALAAGSQTAYIEPGSPWENGYCESFNSKLRDELLNGELFFSLAEAHADRGLATALRRRPAAQLAQLPTAGA